LQNIISQAFAMKGDYVQSVNIFAQKEEAVQKQAFHILCRFS
jgi:hypothetical protein